MRIIWQEFKLLDKSTNHSTETEIIRHIKNNGHDIRYYCSYKYRKLYFGLNKNTIHYFDLPKIKTIRSIVFLFKLFSFNIYLTFFLKTNVVILDYMILLVSWPSILFSKIFDGSIKYILDIRTLPVNKERFKTEFKIFQLSFRIACKLCDGISFITPFMKEFLLANVKHINLPTVIWSSGFNEHLFRPTENHKRTKDFVLFYHGGLSLSRGVLELIKVTKYLKDDGLPVKLKLIGNIVDKEKLYEFIHENRMEDYCSISAPVEIEKIPGLIAECDLPVVPLSHFIGWRVSSPLKLMEYLAMGKCVVATDIEAHRDVMGSMPFAFYAKSEKAEDLKEAIELAYENKHQFNEYGKLARRFVLEKYTWRIQANNLINFLDNLNNE